MIPRRFGNPILVVAFFCASQSSAAPPPLNKEVPGRLGIVFTDNYISETAPARLDPNRIVSIIVRFKGDASKYREPEDLIAEARADKSRAADGVLEKLGNPISIAPVITIERMPISFRKQLQKAIDAGNTDTTIYDKLIDGKPIELGPKGRKETSAEIALHEFSKLTFADDAQANAALARLRKNGQVLSAYKDSTLAFSQAAGALDPYYNSFTFGYQGASATGLSGQWGPKAMSMQALWDVTPGHGNVAILDTGTKLGHPDLIESLRAHRSFGFFAITSGQFAGSVTDFDPTWIDESYQSVLSGTGFGHGTHVHGVVAASHNNLGVRGQCARCNVQIGKISSQTNGERIQTADLANAMRRMIRSGASVINLSLGETLTSDGTNRCGTEIPPSTSGSAIAYGGGSSTYDEYDALCMAIRYATQWDVAIVAAAGNHKQNWLQFPAADRRVISVAGAQLGEYGGAKPSLWDATQPKETADQDSPARLTGYLATDFIEYYKELGSSRGANQWVTAPARDIVSTMYTGTNYYDPIRCGTSATFNAPQPNTHWPTISGGTTIIANGVSAYANPFRHYGVCSGTSMAAPMISGLLGVMRSFVPLMNARSYQFDLAGNLNGYFSSSKQNGDMRGLLRTAARIPTASSYLPMNSWNDQWGYGFPNAQTLLPQLQWRAESANNGTEYTTPLLAMEAANFKDYFYTTSPTMAAAAYHGSLLWPRTETVSYCSQYGANAVNYQNPMGFFALPSDITQGRVISVGFPPLGGPVVTPTLTSCDPQTGRDRVKSIGQIYTAPRDKFGRELLELRRYSFVLPGAGGLSEGRHIYYAHEKSVAIGTGVTSSIGWKYDGIEGYVYPPDQNAPNPQMTRLWLLQKTPSIYRLATDTNKDSLVLNQGYSVIGGAGVGGFWGWIFLY